MRQSNNKGRVRQEMGNIYTDGLEGSFDKAIATLQEQKAYFEEYAKNIDQWEGDYTIEISYEQNEYDDNYSFVVYLNRPENEQEKQKRLDQEAKYHKNKEEYERRQYEALKAKFENK